MEIDLSVVLHVSQSTKPLCYSLVHQETRRPFRWRCKLDVNGEVELRGERLEQAPAVYRDLTQIPIPVFLKRKYRYFSVFLYSTQDNVFKDLYWLLATFGDFWGLQELLKVLQMFTLQTLIDFTHFSQDFLQSM